MIAVIASRLGLPQLAIKLGLLALLALAVAGVLWKAYDKGWDAGKAASDVVWREEMDKQAKASRALVKAEQERWKALVDNASRASEESAKSNDEELARNLEASRGSEVYVPPAMQRLMDEIRRKR